MKERRKRGRREGRMRTLDKERRRDVREWVRRKGANEREEGTKRRLGKEEGGNEKKRKRGNRRGGMKQGQKEGGKQGGKERGGGSPLHHPSIFKLPAAFLL